MLQIGAMIIAVLLMILPIVHLLALLMPIALRVSQVEWNFETVFQFVFLCTGSTLTFVSGVLLLVGVLRRQSVLVLPAIVNTVGDMAHTHTLIYSLLSSCCCSHSVSP